MPDTPSWDEFFSSLTPKTGKRAGRATKADIDDLLLGEHAPQVQAFFDAVKWAEGGQPDLIVGGQKRFDTSKDHPNVVGYTHADGRTSTAAGNYQITGSNWYGGKGRQGLKQRLGANRFDEDSQMQAALMLFGDRDNGAGLEALRNGDFDAALKVASKDWASLPGSPLTGKKRDYNQFKQQFQKNLTTYQQSRQTLNEILGKAPTRADALSKADTNSTVNPDYDQFFDSLGQEPEPKIETESKVVGADVSGQPVLSADAAPPPPPPASNPLANSKVVKLQPRAKTVQAAQPDSTKFAVSTDVSPELIEQAEKELAQNNPDLVTAEKAQKPPQPLLGETSGGMFPVSVDVRSMPNGIDPKEEIFRRGFHQFAANNPNLGLSDSDIEIEINRRKSANEGFLLDDGFKNEWQWATEKDKDFQFRAAISSDDVQRILQNRQKIKTNDDEQRAREQLKAQLDADAKTATGQLKAGMNAGLEIGYNAVTNPLNAAYNSITGNAPRIKSADEQAQNQYQQIIGNNGLSSHVATDRLNEQKQAAEMDVLDRSAELANRTVKQVASHGGNLLQVGGMLESAIKNHLLGQSTATDKTILGDAAKSLRNSFEQNFQTNRALDSSLISRGAQMATDFAVLGAISLMPGGRVLSEATQAAGGAAGLYEDARKHGSSEDAALVSGALGGALSIPQILLFRKWFAAVPSEQKAGVLRQIVNRIKSTTGEENALALAKTAEQAVAIAPKSAIREIAESALHGGAAGGGFQLGANLNAKYGAGYDPQRETTKDVAGTTLEGGAFGLAGGLLAHGNRLLGESINQTEMSVAPVPESTETLAAQRESASKPESPRAAVLYTAGEQMPVPSLNEMAVRVPEGVLVVNETKAAELGFRNEQDLKIYAEENGIQSLLGRAIEVDDTSAGATLQTTDAKTGVELNSSIVDARDTATAQAKLDQEAFPEREIKQEVIPTQAAIQNRIKNRETGNPIDAKNKNVSLIDKISKGVSVPHEPQARPVLQEKPQETSDDANKSAPPHSHAQGDFVAQNPQRVNAEADTNDSSKANNEPETASQPIDVGSRVKVEGKAAEVVKKVYGKARVRFNDGSHRTVNIAEAQVAQPKNEQPAMLPEIADARFSSVAPGEMRFKSKAESVSKTNGVSREAIGRALDENGISRLAPVKVVQSESELPPVVQERIKSTDSNGQIKGVFHGNDLYLVADNLGKNPQDVATTAAHEIVGHYGLRKFTGDKLDTVLDNVSKAIENNRKFQEIAESYNLDLTTPEGRREAAEEYIAHRAETTAFKQTPLYKQVKAVVREALRNLAEKIFGKADALKWTDDDIDNLIQNARKRLQREAENREKLNEMDVRFAKDYHIYTNDSGKNDGKLKDDEFLSDAELYEDATAEKRKLLTWKNAKTITAEALNAPRSLKSSFDLSAPFRQGAVLTLSEPKAAMKAFAQQFKSLSPKKYNEFVERLIDHPAIEQAEKSGLYMSSLADGRSMSGQEEAFMSRWLGDDKLFENKTAEGARKLATLHIRASERAYKSYLDSMRIDAFHKFSDEIREYNLRKGEADDPKQFEALANFINVATGRGDLGKLEDSAQLLNSVFFSARYMASRFQLTNPVYYAKMPAPVREIAMRKLGGFLSTTGVTMALLAAGGATISREMEDPDFLKVRFGDFHFDLSAGVVQPLRYMARMAVAADKRHRQGKPQNTGGSSKEFHLTTRFLESKLAPTPAIAKNLYTGKDYVGKPVTLGGEAVGAVTPMFFNDLGAAFKSEEWQGVAKMIPSFFGVSTSVYDPKAKKTKQKRKAD